MDYKNILKLIFVGLAIISSFFIVVYCVSFLRTKNNALNNNNNDVSDTNLGLIFDSIKGIMPSGGTDVYNKNNISLPSSQKSQKEENIIPVQEEESPADQEIKKENILNRKLLDECLAKAENEWLKLQTHYQSVLTQCVDLNLGLNGEKLFSAGECATQINPYETRDKNRIQADKNDCFTRYSERQ